MTTLSRLDVLPCVHLDSVSVGYGAVSVVHDISLTIPKGKIACLLGPSGCGKTSLLRAIAGFEPVTAGRIVLGERDVSTPSRALPPEQRAVGMVFQDFALFPHLSVADNIGFGLRRHTSSTRQHRITELLELIGLPSLADRYPHQLSGGQQQRVALARAMAPRPTVLLLDEPFSAIDPDFRMQLARDVREMILRDHMTAILVTHDQHEAFAMADQIAVLSHGRVLQYDTSHRLYHAPACREVAAFIGEGTMIRGHVNAEARGIETAFGLLCPPDLSVHQPGARVDVFVRPHHVRLDPHSQLRLRVHSVNFLGPTSRYTLATAQGETVVTHHSGLPHLVGDEVGVCFDPAGLRVFPLPSD